jgi:hypothetical protein
MVAIESTSALVVLPVDSEAAAPTQAGPGSNVPT